MAQGAVPKMRVAIASILFSLVGLAPAAASAAQAQDASRRQTTTLHRAEQVVESLMDQMHTTYDFEPVLTGILAPEVLRGVRESLKADRSIASDRDVLRMYTSALTILYLSGLWRASMEMDGVNLENFNFPDNLPPDLQAAYGKFEELESRHKQGKTAAAEVQELFEKYEKLRAAMLNHIRPGVFTSEPYRKFVEQYRHDSRVSAGGASEKETLYEVWREGFRFTLVEREGALRILGVNPAWAD
jgi:hypothetical protein